MYLHRSPAQHLHKTCRVLVNCWAGISRSATLVLAYLMQHQGMTLHKALRQVLMGYVQYQGMTLHKALGQVLISTRVWVTLTRPSDRY